MNKMKNTISIIGFYLLLSISSCAPEKPEEQVYMGTYPLGDIKDYLYFKPGSMWVYECDSTGELDTQIMVSCDTPWIIESYIKYQMLNRVIKSINEGSVYTDSRPTNVYGYISNYQYFWSITRWRDDKKGVNTGADCIFFKPYDTNSPSGFGSSESHFKGTLYNYKVLKITYDSVKVFKVDIGGTFPRPKIKTIHYGVIEYYYAKNIGIVQIKVSTGKEGDINRIFNFNWNLIAFKVTQ